jgi:hypothetical protein
MLYVLLPLLVSRGAGAQSYVSSVVARPGRVIDGETLTTILPGSVDLNDNGVVVFKAWFQTVDGPYGGEGIFTLNRLLVAKGDVIEGTELTGISATVSLNEAGDVAFASFFDSSSSFDFGLFTQDRIIALPGYLADGRSMLGFASPALNDLGHVAFGAALYAPSSSSYDHAVVLDDQLIVSSGETIDGRTLSIFYLPYLNNRGEIAIVVAFDDFTEAVILARPATLAYLIGAVGGLVDQGELNGGQGNALTMKLEGALAALDDGRIRVAINNLDAFIHQVRAFVKAGVLSPGEGLALTEVAEALINQL